MYIVFFIHLHFVYHPNRWHFPVDLPHKPSGRVESRKKKIESKVEKIQIKEEIEKEEKIENKKDKIENRETYFQRKSAGNKPEEEKSAQIIESHKADDVVDVKDSKDTHKMEDVEGTKNKDKKDRSFVGKLKGLFKL